MEAEAVKIDIKNGTATGNDSIDIDTLKALEDAILETCKNSIRIPIVWFNASMVIIFKKGIK